MALWQECENLDQQPSRGGNVSYNVVVRPRSYGYYNFTAAQVTYLPTEESTQVPLI